MARPKDDADKLKKDRQERRALLNGLQDSDFDEISEVTNPAIHVHLPPAKSPPPAAPPPPRASLASSETVLSALDRLPTHHRVWVVLGIIVAVVVLVLAGRLAF